MLEYIKKLDKLSWYAPFMVATKDLKNDQFMQGLHKDLAKDLKVAGVCDACFNKLIDWAFVIEQGNEEKKEQKMKEQRKCGPGEVSS